MKVYIVTSGIYSDYAINAVFTDKAIAERYCQDNRADSLQIESWTTNVEEHVKQGRAPYFCRVAKDGTIVELSKPWEHACCDDPRGVTIGWDWSNQLYMNVWARDEAHARKIAMERWSIIKSCGPWGDRNAVARWRKEARNYEAS